MLHINRLQAAFAVVALLFALPGLAQIQSSGHFMSSRLDPGWDLRGTAKLTAPDIDLQGSGWLRLTGSQSQAMGVALDKGATIDPARGFSLAFTYDVWGGGSAGGDGLSVFLFDAGTDMIGAASGGALGYCKGAGAWLGLGLDVSGNFSNPQEGCAGGGGPGTKPQSIALRGPAASTNAFVTQTALPSGLDKPQATVRPLAGQVILTVLPKAQGTGFAVTVQWRGDPGQPFKRILDSVDFPYPAPAALRVGVAASTGAGKNIHEVRAIVVRALASPSVGLAFEPASIAAGGKSKMVLRLAGDKGTATLDRAFKLQLPEGLKIALPPHLGGSCMGSIRVSSEDSVTVDQGTAAGTAGCTVEVEVTAEEPGALTATVPANALATDMGSNAQPASARLTVR
jgi:hypothetical protein